MKAQIHLDGEPIFTSNKISEINLSKKIDELTRTNNVMKMEDKVKRGFKVFRSDSNYTTK